MDYNDNFRRRDGAPPVRAMLRRIAGMLAVLVAVAGCSRFEFLYAFAGAAIEEKAARYLDLDEAGEELVASQTEAFLAWHRKAMLPRYARFLDAQTAIAEQGGYDRKKISAMLSGLRRLLDETVVGAAPFVATVLIEHTAPDKLRHMGERIAERHAELVDELNSPDAERLEEKIEDVTDNFERFLDALHGEQIDQVKIYAQASLQFAESWLVNRAGRQRALTAFLAGQPNRKQIAIFLHKVLLRSHEVADPDYAVVAEARWKVFENLLFGVLSTMSKAQAAYFVETLGGYAGDMRDLSS